MSVSALTSICLRERISACTCSLTSQTLTFMPAATRSVLQPEGNELAAFAVATEHDLIGRVVSPEYSMPTSYWSEKKYGSSS